MRAFVVLLFLLPFSVFGQALRVISYNVRYDNPSDGPNKWDLRKGELVKQIDRYHPAIFGIQEGLHHQTLFIDSCLPDFTFVGVGRENGKTKGEYAAIYYDTTKLNITTSKTFWFSETPKKPSKDWDANHKRICTYASFEHIASGQKLWFFNVHLDHESKKSRKNSVKLLIEAIDKIVPEETAILIAGDFNCSPSDAPIKFMRKYFIDSYRKAKVRKTKCDGTFNNFDKNFTPDNRIDYIFVKNLTVKKYEHKFERRLDDYFISDHLPIIVDVEFIEK